ncbi:hypothetical protein [Chitinophaga sp. S165]|uniref:hypothetical protein n=1 Tax=Chitinophaga sp. S165 TaxID=2135462 RepID=UPI000D70A099|nr:hypothetical protein [Chitinophaga sp. S165]PWV49586.1 hypothetical protein C7475_10594 [Chitinophaga sp. S165]
MTESLFLTIAAAMTNFVSSIYTGAGEKIGETIADTICKKVRGLFKKEDQELLIQFENQPESKELKEWFENKLEKSILNKNQLQKDVRYILDIMSVDAALLQTHLDTYKRLKHEYNLLIIEFIDADNGVNDEWYNRKENFEKKFHALNKMVKTMLEPCGI